MNSLQFLYLLAVVLVINMGVVSYLLIYFPQTLACQPGDEECENRLDELRRACTPMTTVISAGNETNSLKIEITRYWENGECIRKEEVIDDVDSGITYYDITGYETTCVVTPEEYEKFGLYACNGSLLPFVVPGEMEGIFGSGDSIEGFIFQAYCSLDADDCHAEAAKHVTECLEADILMDQEIGHTGGGKSYWTLYLKIRRRPEEYYARRKVPERCVLYHELVNAVNLPPEMPPQVVGMNMTCTVELSKFPISGVSIKWCEGELVDYIQLIYP